MTAWMEQAACAQIGPGLFYVGEKAQVREYDAARSVCTTCPVQADCLDFALEVDDRHGMWGGLTPGERDQVRNKRGLHRGGDHGTSATRESQVRDDRILARYEATGSRDGAYIAAELGITVAAFNARMARARKRRDSRQQVAS